jgi:hypothetical protein
MAKELIDIIIACIVCFCFRNVVKKYEKRKAYRLTDEIHDKTRLICLSIHIHIYIYICRRQIVILGKRILTRQKCYLLGQMLKCHRNAIYLTI